MELECMVALIVGGIVILMTALALAVVVKTKKNKKEGK